MSAEGRKQDWEGFTRQRRNVLALSVVLLAIDLSGISIQELNLLGNRADVTKPELITASLWLLLCYFFIRYVYYLVRVDGIGEGASYIRSEYQRLVIDRAFREAIKDEDPKDYVDTKKYGPNSARSAAFTMGNCNMYGNGQPIWKFEFDWNVMLVTDDGPEWLKIGSKEFKRHRRELRWEYFRAVVSLLLKTRVPTEFYLPLIFPLGVSLAAMLV